MKESPIQYEIRQALARRGDNVMWRNQVGKATHYKGGRTCPTCHQPTLGARKWVVPYGLCPGSSDLIGFTSILLAPGHPVAVFTALEVKGDRGREREEQQLFRELVNERGGVAAVVRSVEEANNIITQIGVTKLWTSR